MAKTANLFSNKSRRGLTTLGGKGSSITIDSIEWGTQQEMIFHKLLRLWFNTL
jgi:hypothetical protein